MLVAVVAVVARNLAYKLSLIGFCWRLLWKYRPLLWNKRSSWNICPHFLQNLLLLVSGRQICILHCFHISSLIPQCRALPGRSPPRFTEPHGGNGLRELENVDGPKLQTMDHPPRFDGFVGRNLPKHIGSMYGIFTHIWLIFMVNLGRYTIHGFRKLPELFFCNIEFRAQYHLESHTFNLGGWGKFMSPLLLNGGFGDRNAAYFGSWNDLQHNLYDLGNSACDLFGILKTWPFKDYMD